MLFGLRVLLMLLTCAVWAPCIVDVVDLCCSGSARIAAVVLNLIPGEYIVSPGKEKLPRPATKLLLSVLIKA